MKTQARNPIRRRLSEATLPRTRSIIPKISARRKLSKLCQFEKARQRQLLLLDGKVKAVLPVPPKMKMINLVKKFLDVNEPETTCAQASVAFKHFEGGKLTNSSSMMFRERTKLVNLTVEDGILRIEPIGKKSRKRSGSSQFSGGSTLSRSGRARKSVAQYHLSTMLSIRMSKTKANTFALTFFSDQENGEDQDNWTAIPEVTQINVKLEQSESLEQWMTCFLQHLKYLTEYNSRLVEQFKTDLQNSHVSLQTEQGRALENNVERLIRVNVDLCAVIYGYQSKTLAEEYARLGIHLANSSDKFHEASYWQEKAMRQKQIAENIVEDEVLQKIRDTVLAL